MAEAPMPAPEPRPARRRSPSPFDVDHDGVVTDTDLALVEPRPLWKRLGLHGPAVVLMWFGRNAKRIAVLVLGLVVLGAGLAMMVLPGPGVLVILVGLAILATEFVWAERALDAARRRAGAVTRTANGSAAGRGALLVSAAALVVGGVAVGLALDRYRMAGVGMVVAGVVGIATMHPAVQRWLDRPSRVEVAEAAEEP
jgi:uncharacterized protein (TIGR02611 family)